MINGSILNLKKCNSSLIYAFFLMLLAFPGMATAQNDTTKTKDKEFDPQSVILEHIGDSHSWPVLAKTSIPLPVILYTDKGMESFSSANLQPEGAIYKGTYYNYKLEENKVKAVDATGKILEDASVWDFSITRNVISMLMTTFILLLVFLVVSRKYKKTIGKAPKGLQSFMEPLILFVRDDIAIPNLGIKYTRFMPLLLTIFFFILINNLFGMIPFFPGGFNLTGNIAVTAVLAVIILFVVNLNGNKHYWKHIF